MTRFFVLFEQMISKTAMLKRSVFIFLFLWFLMVWRVLPLEARTFLLGPRSLPQILQQSPIVCVGTVRTIHSEGLDRFDTENVTGPNAEPYLVPAPKSVADVTIEETIKGTPLPGTISVAFAAPISGEVVDKFTRFQFASLMPGERVLLFLQRDPATEQYRLRFPLQDHSYRLFFPSQPIVIGTAALPESAPAQTPLRRVLLYLAEAIQKTQADDTRENCLLWIGEGGFLLYLDTNPKNADREPNLTRRQERLALGETTGLEQFVEEQIVPKVRQAVHDSDGSIHRQALAAGAELQDVTLIPAIALAADVEIRSAGDHDSLSGYGSVLGRYRVPAAVRHLLPLLSYDKPTVRAGASLALGNLADPLAIPFLLDRLTVETDNAILYREIAGLHTLTGARSPFSTADSQAKKANLISFWQQWAADHQTQINILRAQYAGHSIL